MKLLRLWRRSPGSAEVLEDWLVDVANARGARIVSRSEAPVALDPPSEAELPNEELVVGLMLPQNRDRPQILRLAAQLISRSAVAFGDLARLAEMERVEFILAELARQVAKVDPAHPLWSRIGRKFQVPETPGLALLHYTRLAQPVMKDGRMNVEKWVLVS